jgi:hypothetical protein
MIHRPSAGLPASVGRASLPLRITIAAVFLVTTAILLGAGVFIAPESRLAFVVAVVMIEPIGIIGVVAAAFVLAPHSRFGVWLDHFVPRLREPLVAILTAFALWGVAAAIACTIPRHG